jgi:chemotaxis protein methyltransferase CheR
MELSPAAQSAIADILFNHTGQELTENRKWRLSTSLNNVLRKHGVTQNEELAQRLDQPSEAILHRDLVEALINNETYFFRDRPTFDQLPKDILPLLKQRRESHRTLKIWCAGCSTGQEAYSLAMLFADNIKLWGDWSISILATDVSGKAIDAARSGLYSQFEVQRGLSITQMLHHFDETQKGWQLDSAIQNRVRFVQHNILNAPPARNRFDLVLCRNVLLYFDAETRAHIFARLHEAIRSDGFLMLGAGETSVGRTSCFSPSGERPSIFEPVSR